MMESDETYRIPCSPKRNVVDEYLKGVNINTELICEIHSESMYMDVSEQYYTEVASFLHQVDLYKKGGT